TSNGGTVALVGARAVNSGSIVAQGGTAGLVSADTVTVDFAGDGLTTFKVSPGLFGSVENSGTVQADGGRVVLMTTSGSQVAQGVVNTRGVLRADSLASRGGEIVLDSGSSAAGVTINGGLLSAVGHGAGQSGGKVDVEGRTVLLQPATGAGDGDGVIDASGAAGGGRVRLHATAVGGEPNTGAIAVASGSRISADATVVGNGGDIRVMAERTLRAYGTLTAKGGPSGGDGGFIETSGGYAVPVGDSNGGIDLKGLRTDASAPAGKPGRWLIDPFDVTITNGEGEGEGGGGTPIESPFVPIGESLLLTADINAALDEGTDVLITTGIGGEQAGNVTFADAAIIQRTSPGAAPVTFQIDANQSIATTGEGATIVSTGGPLNVVFRAGLGGAGDITYDGQITTSGGKLSMNAIGGGIFHTGDVSTTGGNVAMTAGTGLFYTGDIVAGTGSVSLSTGGTGGIVFTGDIAGGGLTMGAGGAINMTGDIAMGQGGVDIRSGIGGFGGINLFGDITAQKSVTVAAGTAGPGQLQFFGDIDTGGGDVTLSAAGNGFNAPALQYGGFITTNGGNVSMQASQGNSPACTICLGGEIDTRVAGTNNGGSVTIVGTRAPALQAPDAPDAVVRVSDTVISTGSGNVTITGLGGSGGTGVEIAQVEEATTIFTTTGNIVITGVGSTLIGNSFEAPGHGVLIDGAQIQSQGGRIAVRGLRLAGPEDGNGVLVTGGASITTTGTGTIEITGQSLIPTAGVLIEPDIEAAAGTRVVDGNSHVVLRASSVGGVDALQILGNVHAGGVLNLRPGGVDAQGNAADRVADAITLAGTAASGFAVSAAEFALLDAGAFTVGSNLHAGPITVLGPMSMASPLTLQNGAGGGISLQAPVTTPYLGLLSGGSITQAPGASIVADKLLARSGSGDVRLDDPGNNVATGTVGGGAAGLFAYTDANDVTLGMVPVTVFDAASNLPQTLPGAPVSADRVIVRTLSGDLSLATDVSSTSGTDLVAASRFQNRGDYTISGAPWRIWASSWTDETRGGIAGSGPLPNLYACTYLGGCAVNVTADANHFIYTQQPSATVVINNASRPGAFANPTFTYGITGLQLGDAGAGFTGRLETPATRLSASGFYPITGTFTSAEGYAVSVVAGQFTVTGLPETLRPDAVREDTNTWLYDRNLRAAAMCFATGPLSGDQASQGGDVLAREWSKVRSRPNLTSCVDTERRNGCSDF
uniref:MBG-2 domain-containing protein n=1 Tax=Variovorax sp. KK3 TaxID=1855728 RepID=UPI0015C3B763